ncbi:MAG: redox-sensing transcriptional repressor Rex [Candidatus Omnitrophica bacterium]|nr:redox-sensing transcriptional repressor Rex [Candidatus Omnitrophota bacterium]MCF7893540.1 redox-sensing transcriptional repressor Rex [Candidatus Omnitrophota bacterium]
MKSISRKTIDRALLYIRALENLLKEKRDKISSLELADITGSSDVQIRKDISFFGKVGTPRIGYETKKLKDILENFILQNNVVHIALFGVGNLGKAILKYPGFQTDKIKLVAAFDKAKSKLLKEINGIKIYPVERSVELIKKVHAEIGIIAVPPRSSQEVADIMVKAGLKGIINFAPSCISVPKNTFVKNIDFSIEILSIFSHTQFQK